MTDRPACCSRLMHSHGATRYLCPDCGKSVSKLPLSLKSVHPDIWKLEVDEWPSAPLDIFNNRPIIYLPRTHPHRNRGGWQYLSRHIVMQTTGEILRSDEHVHHADGNKLNCRRDNLMVMLAESHGRHHAGYQLLYMLRDRDTGRFISSTVPSYADQIASDYSTPVYDSLSDIPF